MPDSSSDPGIPKVSIGMPVYNGGTLVAQAIESLCAQEFRDFELILSDNASTDGTEQVCRAYAAEDNRIRYVRRDQNYGMNNNGRHVLSLARAPYYMAAAHDDRWDPRFIGACVEQFEKNPSLVLVSPRVAFINTESASIDIPYPPLHTVGMGIRSRVAAIFNQINVGYNAYGMYRTDALRRIDMKIELFAGDVVMLLEIMFLGETAHVPEPLFTYRFKPRTTQEHVAAAIKGAPANKTVPLYTVLTINLLRAIVNAPADRKLKNILLSDAIQIVALKNGFWREQLLKENPGLRDYIEPERDGFLPSVEHNIVGAFAGLLLPHCPPGAPFEGIIELDEKHSDHALSALDRARPVPGRQEFADSLQNLIQTRRLIEALAYYDDYARYQVPSPAITKMGVFLESVRTTSVSRNRTSGNDTAKKVRVLVQAPFYPASANTVEITAMRRIMGRLSLLGHQVRVATTLPDDLSAIDIIHSFSTNPPDIVEGFINAAINGKKTFVLTPLWNPVFDYHAQAWLSFQTMKRYIEKGQRPETFAEMQHSMIATPFLPRYVSRGVVRYAHRLFASGRSESAALRQWDHGAPVSIVPLGSDLVPGEASAEPFIQKFGIRDFVLCSGELSTLNNQLMLLFILEHDDIPIVLADGGFTSDPYYAALCRKMKRKGPTIITGPIADDLLASGYRAARVHCLPAWYDRSGSAAIEAARYGCAVVASNQGVVRDYLGDFCLYCEPGSPGSIRAAIEKAFSERAIKGAQERASSFTWKKTVDGIEEVYRELTG